MIEVLIWFILIVWGVYLVCIIYNIISNLIFEIKESKDVTVYASEEEKEKKMKEMGEEIYKRKMKSLVIVEHNGWRYIWPQDFSHFFLPLKDGNKAMYSLTDGYILKGIENVPVMKVWDDFFQDFLKLVYTVNGSSILWINGLK